MRSGNIEDLRLDACTSKQFVVFHACFMFEAYADVAWSGRIPLQYEVKSGYKLHALSIHKHRRTHVVCEVATVSAFSRSVQDSQQYVFVSAASLSWGSHAFVVQGCKMLGFALARISSTL